MAAHDLSGRTVVLTGASSGVGRATALAFAAEGANLVLVSRRQAVLEALATECEAAGAQAIAVAADTGDAEAIQRVAQTAAERFGRIDVWINNAGVGAMGEFNDTPLAAHERVIRTNLLGYFNGAYAALPYFKRQQRGILINTLSLGAWVPAPYATSYSASKFGLRGFSEALRGELFAHPDIHVCDVFPTFLDTPGFRHGGNYLGRYVKPIPPLYDPRRVAQAMVKLAKRPQNAVTVGATATLARVLHALAPGLVTSGFARAVDAGVKQAPRTANSHGTLFESNGVDSAIDGGYRGRPGAKRQPPVGTGSAAALLVGALVGIYLARKD